MNHKDFVAKLKELEACQDAVDFVFKNKYTMKQAWDNCVRADWMLWLAYKMEIGTKQERTHATCDCAATALKYVPKGEDRPRLAIEAARAYADNPSEDSLSKLNAAGDAAWAAAGAATGAAAWAAAGAAAGDAAWAAAGAAAYKEMCVLIRKRIKI